MQDAASGARWALADPSAVHFRHWGDEVVVYDEAHALTHLLDPLAGSVLLALVAQSDGLDQIQLRAAVFELSSDADSVEELAQIDRSLAGLGELGLATRVAE